MSYNNMILVSDFAKTKLILTQRAIYSKTAHLITDFDDTMTDSNSKSKFKFKSHWNALFSLMNDKTQNEYESICEKYYNKYCQGTLSPEEEISWPKESLQLLIREKVTKDHFRRAAKRIVPRKNLKNLISLFGPEKCAIISYGIYDVIEQFLKINHLEKIEIYATRCIFDENEILVGYNESSILAPYQKGECLIDFSKKRNVPVDNIMTMGDSKGDESMFLDETLNIVITNGDAKKDIKNSDVVLVNNNFCTLVNFFNNYRPRIY